MTITSEASTKSIPANIEAERAVLGALLIDPDAIIKIANFLRAEDFYRERNSWIYGAILALHERREPADFVTLVDELERREQLEEVGGPAYVTELINSTPTAIYVDYYARIVERTAILRRLIGAAGKIAELAYDEGQDVDEVVDRAEQIIFGISESRIHRDLTPVRAIISNVVDRIDFLARNRDTLMGVPTGFTLMDKLLGGFQKSDLIIVAGRPGMGKTSLGLSVAQNAAKRYQVRVAVFSLEMSNEQLVQRLLSMETGIDSHRLRMGEIYEEEWPILMEAANTLAATSIFIDDTPGATVMDMRTKARRLYAEHGLDMILVDYMQLMSGGQGLGRGENRQQEISYISRSLKGLARELNVPVVAVSQLSRAVESRSDKRPMLSDLRESGCLSGDTPIYLPATGQYVPIRELAGQAGFQVIGLNAETLKLEVGVVSRAFCTGRKPVYRLTTRMGCTLRATANHRFLTIHGWRRLDDLTVQDRIALPRRLHNLPSFENSLGDAEVALLAHLTGDGCTLPCHAIQYTTREKDLADAVVDLVTEVFKDQVAWATDGCIHMTGGKCPRTSIYYASSSERLAQGVPSLLLRLGINARLSRHPQAGKGREQFHVTVSGKSEVDEYVSRIGAVGEYRNRQLESMRHFRVSRVSNTNRDVLPSDVWRMYVVPAIHRNAFTTREFQARLGNAYWSSAHYHTNLGRERGAMVAAVVGSDEVARLSVSDVYWDEVVSIEPDGEVDVYDLTVPGLHNFVAADVIVHNSIEQDADVVLFVYREDYYVEDTDRQNIADILVAKHRHGSTGTVSLFFRKELTQFRDLELRTENLDY